jgi:hypothetical protein
VVKQQKQGKLLTLSPRIVLGAERLIQRGLTMSTALVERVHLPVRQALAPLGRKTYRCCKDRERLRQPLPPQERTRHGAIRPRWRARTPALATGLTEHVWTFRELLTAKFEP